MLPLRRRLVVLALTVATILLGTQVSAFGGVLNTPIEAKQFSSVPYIHRSFWMQPWRSYLDTWPASRMRKGIGINFNVTPAEAQATAKVLAANGFRRARMEIAWNQLSPDNPSQLTARSEKAMRERLLALRANGIRPLILLNANDAEPTPTKTVPIQLAAAAPAGARQVLLTLASRTAVVPGRSGFDFDGMAAGVLITSVAATGLAQLSRPLPTALAAGTQNLRILEQEPFALPLLSNGSPNPRFERTLAGWLRYVKTTTSYVKSVLGTDDFDVEIWNELTFGSRFLVNSFYYNPVPEAGQGNSLNTLDAILRRTVAFLRNPDNGVSHVRIGDGFANQTNVPGGADMPAGLTAIDKHPYSTGYTYPKEQTFTGQTPVDANGVPNFKVLPDSTRKDSFVPSFREHMPEQLLTAFKTETLIRDLSPVINAGFKGSPHGRNAAPPGGGPPPEMWLTEYNYPMSALDPDVTPAMTSDEHAFMHTKVALRTYSAYLNKGATQVDMYAAKGGENLQMIPTGFFDEIKRNPTRVPSDPGETLRSVGRLASSMSGPATISNQRSLTLDRVADTHDHSQFAGNGTNSYPPLYNRNMLAFLPFQADDNRFVVPVYVMTVDVSHNYLPGTPAGTPGRLQLPDETYSLTIGGVKGQTATAAYIDPITGQDKSVTITGRTDTTVTVSLAATDYPRILTLTDGNSLVGASLKPPPGLVGGSFGKGPDLALRVPQVRSKRALKRGITVRIACPRACAFGMALTPRRKSSRVLGKRQFAGLQAQKATSVRIRLDERGRRWLRRHRSGAMRLWTFAIYDNMTAAFGTRAFRSR